MFTFPSIKIPRAVGPAMARHHGLDCFTALAGLATVHYAVDVLKCSLSRGGAALCGQAWSRLAALNMMRPSVVLSDGLQLFIDRHRI